MGVLSESNVNSEFMASGKPKERQFQVVAVPSTFTRGRWECRDFEDQQEVEKDILEFDKPDPTASSSDLAHTTTTTTSFHPDDSASGGITFTAACETPKESSTIVVTSVVSSSQKVTNTNSESHPENRSAETLKTVATNIVQYEVPSTTAQSAISVGGQPVATQYVQQTEIITTAKPEILSGAQPNASIHEVNKMGVVTAISTQTQSITTIDPIDPEPVPATATTATVASTSLPVVAIDNKIEQAMDLVKTHLTFAVREEVEILKNTILELESKVAMLENQNQILRQFAPPEVVANLPLLVQSTALRHQHSQPGGVISPPVSNTQPQFPVATQANIPITTSTNVQPINPAPSVPISQQSVQPQRQISTSQNVQPSHVQHK